ncbi:MAG: amino acid--[acyl-carrier-protein] ligase [Alphaproteobacteria bacterium]|nr:amino acid--[acyl-carrier-protein] ligase [Alphaproteobacteria bacterium]
MNPALKDTANAETATAPLATLGPVLFRPMGADGVYARTALYEEVIERLARLISRHREPGTEILRFPPVMSRHQVEKSGYLKSFPNLLGCVCALHGTEAEIRSAADRHEVGGDWTAALAAADLVLSPAACYPVYPLAADRGAVPQQGLYFDVACECFRREPSRHLDRLQSFRMREYVCIARPEQILEFRERWIARAQDMAEQLGLARRIAPASDPFFGRTGQVMAISQLQQELKFELLVPLHSQEQPTACMSFNYHQDHFGEIWGLRDAGGTVMHTGCVAFGMDRLAVALFCLHGLQPRDWPAPVRRALEL